MSTSPTRPPSRTDSQFSDAVRSTRRRVDPTFTPPPLRLWPEVVRRIDRLWVPQQAPHHSIMGQTRSGKSYLITRGLLPLVGRENVLTIDCKGGDETLLGYCGKPVKAIPTRLRKLSNESRPKENWYHLIVADHRAQARDQVAEALERVYKEGDWVVVVDETRAVADPRSPGLGLQPLLDRMWLRGGGRGITVVAGTQAPRWVPSSFYDQCAFVWCSRIRDQHAHQRVMEIGSMTKDHIPVIARIRKRQWLYMDDEEDETWSALTTLTT